MNDLLFSMREKNCIYIKSKSFPVIVEDHERKREKERKKRRKKKKLLVQAKGQNATKAPRPSYGVEEG